MKLEVGEQFYFPFKIPQSEKLQSSQKSSETIFLNASLDLSKKIVENHID